jgi:hypothetical protein
MATIGCGISHKDTKRTNKCSNKKQEQHRNKTTKPQIPFQNTVKITQKKFDIKYTHNIQGPHNIQ